MRNCLFRVRYNNSLMKMSKFIRAYRFEIMMMVLVAIAILFLIGDDTHNAVRGFTDRISIAVGLFMMQLWEGIRLRLFGLSPSDYVGLGLLIVAAVLIYWRMRWRVASAPRLNTQVCPLCGSKLHRAHRKSLDKVIGGVLFLSLRRYKCVNSECSWNGLLTAESRKIKSEVSTHHE